MKIRQLIYLLALTLFFTNCQPDTKTQEQPKLLKALIIDGQSNHGVWPKTTVMMKDYLEQTGLFEVDINRTAYTWQGPHFDPSIGLDDIKELLSMYPVQLEKKTVALDTPRADPDFSPDFEKYDVVISNFGWMATHWPEQTKKNFEKYMANGGGFVAVHAATNSWGDWEEYNKIIGLGGWGGRNESSGPYVYYDNDGNIQRDTTAGGAGSHGAQQEFVLQTRAPEHPIMKGLPANWMHTKDELYDRFRGPAENMTILATAYSDSVKNSPPWNKSVTGTGRHEPLLLTVEYGKGRTFHTGLGHMGYSMECVGFMTTFQRGAEWAATGQVTQDVPADFPGDSTTSFRKWEK